jgi:hypothetical protein
LKSEQAAEYATFDFIKECGRKITPAIIKAENIIESTVGIRVG